MRPLLALCPQAFAEAFEAFDITVEEFLSDTMTLKSVVLYHVLDSEVGKVWRGVGTRGTCGGKMGAAQYSMLVFVSLGSELRVTRALGHNVVGRLVPQCCRQT